MNTKHAVLYYPDRPFPNTGIMWIEGKGFHNEELPDPCYTLMQLAEVAINRGITHLWVSPGYGDFEQQKSYDAWSFSPIERNKKMAACNVWKRGGSRSHVTIIFPQYTAWVNTFGEAAPHDLLIAIRYLEQVLGVPIGMSPGRAGWNYLKKIHPEWVEDIPGVDLKDCHFVSTAGTDIIFQRLLKSAERLKKFLHKFDRGGAYPYAATQTDEGTGTPVHLEGDAAALAATHEKGHPQEVGVWRCSIQYNGAVYSPDMPLAWKEDKGTYAGSEGWLSGPIIRLLRKVGHTVTVHEGWVFPQRHDVLVKWSKDLWQFRQDFSAPGKYASVSGAKLAADATKQIMNSTVGMTAFKRFEGEDEMKRPDIRLQVIARHREITWHNIDKTRMMYGVTPVLVYMDAVYYMSDEPDGRKAIPELVKREGQLGGFRWEGSVEVTPDVLAMFDSKLSETERLTFLNKKGWVK